MYRTGTFGNVRFTKEKGAEFRAFLVSLKTFVFMLVYSSPRIKYAAAASALSNPIPEL